jgi:hypothetical protein
MDRDSGAPGDHRRGTNDIGDEPPAAYRDAAPDVLSPIDPSAPVSGHVPGAPKPAASIADSPEHDWTAASEIIFPSLRPPGTTGLVMEEIDAAALSADAARSHSQPLFDEGPCGLVVVYSLPADGFDVIVNGDHLLSWGVAPEAIQQAALRNLEAWSKRAAWTDEASGDRRLISSDTGDGWDASRILLPEVLDHLAREFAGAGRILVGVPERHLLVAGALGSDDESFGGLFRDFVVEHSGGADEPIDRRVFELVDGHLVEAAGLVDLA